jgi:hypothetical protein
MRSRTFLNSLVLTTLLGTALPGCKSTGQGMGESHTGSVRATFSWEQSAPESGMLTATVSAPGTPPETYAGKFYQITKDSQVETMGDLWTPWYSGWGGWESWGPVPETSFVQHYTGHVVATLSSPDGRRMRCQFQLNRSGAGMKGGGAGQCQLPSGQTIDAEFPPS